MAAAALLNMDRDRAKTGWKAWRAAIGARTPTRLVDYAAVVHFRARPDAANVLTNAPWYAPGIYARSKLADAYRVVTGLCEPVNGLGMPMAFLLARDEREANLAAGQGKISSAGFIEAFICATRNGRVCVMERVHRMVTMGTRPWVSLWPIWNTLLASEAGADSAASHEWLYTHTGEAPADGISIHTSTSLKWLRGLASRHPPSGATPPSSFKLLTYTPDMAQYCLEEQKLADSEANIGDLMPHVIARLPSHCITWLVCRRSYPRSAAYAACCDALLSVGMTAANVHPLMEHYIPFTNPIAAIRALYHTGRHLTPDTIRAIQDYCITQLHASAAMRTVIEGYTTKQQ